jgi:polyisoprenoid-binding protein YceI
MDKTSGNTDKIASSANQRHARAADGSDDTGTMRRLLILMACLGCPLFAASSQAEQIVLSPPSSRVELRIYGMGLLPFDGSFARFHGLMRYDAASPAKCQVVLEVDPASLAMSNDSMREQIIGPDFIDVAQFPQLAFHGGCEGETIAGDLTLHGQTHPFTLDLERSARGMVATGHLRRAEWGITARPLMGGTTIRIRVEIPNPPPGSHT